MAMNLKSPQQHKSSTPTILSENLPSLSIDQDASEEEDLLSTDLLHKMDIEDISELKKYFFNEDRIKALDSKHLQESQVHGLSLSKAEFIEALEHLAESSMVALSAAKLFESLDVDKVGTLRWKQVLDAIIEKTREPLEGNMDDWQPISNYNLHYAAHCKREFIVKVVPLYTKLTFCYTVISKLGRVGVYDGEFHLLDIYNIALKPTTGIKDYLPGEQEDRQKRSTTTWVTDAVFVPDTYALFFSASDRSLHLYDATGLIHVPLCLISGLRNTPLCMDYYSSNDPAKPSLLFFGDDKGDATVMQFHQPKTTLFKKKDPDKLDKFLWSELEEQKDYVTYYIQKNVHSEPILQISYIPESQTILTCSNDPVRTMVLRHTEKRRKSYIFTVIRGIKSFHLEKSLHLIATGSKDGIVRLWNQVVTKQPIISLHGHKAPIVDVRILKHLSIILSLSEKGVLKVWNLHDYYCQMTLPLEFPALKVLGSKTEFGTRSIFPGPSVSNIIDELNFLNTKENSKINSFTEEIETWLSTRDFEVREDEEWSRNSVVIICCNFMALIRLNPLPSMKVPELLRKYKIFPPPEKEHYASVPSPWKIADFFTKTPPEEAEESSTTKSSDSSTMSKNIPMSKTFRKVQGMTADPVKAPMSNMNTKRTQFKIKQERMKMLVEHCAPHLALDLHELAPIKFSRPLPRTRRMIECGIDISDPEQLLKEDIFKDSTVTTGGTASDTQSQHSSKSSKLTAVKKSAILSQKGRHTPDWFADKIKFSPPDSSETSEDDTKLTD